MTLVLTVDMHVVGVTGQHFSQLKRSHITDSLFFTASRYNLWQEETNGYKQMK